MNYKTETPEDRLVIYKKMLLHYRFAWLNKHCWGIIPMHFFVYLESELKVSPFNLPEYLDVYVQSLENGIKEDGVSWRIKLIKKIIVLTENIIHRDNVNRQVDINIESIKYGY